MPYAPSAGAKLYYEECGAGDPIIFVHEFGGDMRSWEPQVRFFSRKYRCITFNARGYPPSDVPEDVSAYSQDRALEDIAAVLRSLSLPNAHVVGLSMGGFAALYFAMRYPEMTRSAVVAGAGYGTRPDQKEAFVADSLALAERIENQGAKKMAEWYAEGAYRTQLRDKNPRAWEEFRRFLSEHSAAGMARTMRGVQSKRPSFWDLKDQLSRIDIPILIVSGDEDDWCLEPDIFLKRNIPTAGLWIVPNTGHTLNLEEPELFNGMLWYFFSMVESGRWGRHNTRTSSASALLSGEQAVSAASSGRV